MATPSIWVRLYYRSEERVEIQDNCIDIGIAEISNGNISGLTRRLKEVDMKNDLSHCDRGRIHVYRPGTVPPYSEANLIPLGEKLVDLIEELKNTSPPTSDGHPFIVVAPAPHPPQQGQPLRPLLSEEVVAKIENSVCVLIEEGKTIGSGFAVSNNRVYTTAHHWEEEEDEGATYFAVAVGDKVECIHGKPSANKRYNLQVVKLDEHLDYCILEIVGDHTFTECLETEVSPNLTLTTPVFLAAYQIGIQECLDEYEMGVTLGITCGTIVRRGNRHVLHSCASFKGDSGGAIVISNGKVIGLHMASINEAKELLDVTSVDFGSVADSINQLCDAQSSGSVALLVSAIGP